MILILLLITAKEVEHSQAKRWNYRAVCFASSEDEDSAVLQVLDTRGNRQHTDIAQDAKNGTERIPL